MLETTSNLSVKQNQSENGSPRHQLSLPLIGKNRSRNYEQIKSEIEMNQKGDKGQLMLPNIQESRVVLESSEKVKRRDIRNNNQFAKRVRQKLDLVLGQMPQPQHQVSNDQYEQPDSDFEQKINKNKQIIKMHRLKRQSENLIGESRKKDLKHKKYSKNRNESTYEKRVKQQSIQNKYLEKKKQFLKEKSADLKENGIYNGQSMKNLKPKQDNLYRNDKNELRKMDPRKMPPRAISNKSNQKVVVDNQKNSNLFDGIQNLLENPSQNKHKQFEKPLVGLTLLKAKRDLQDKIRIINEKLGSGGSAESPKKDEHRLNILQSTSRQWRKVSISPNHIETLTSNFDKELQKISSLQERNSVCIQRYLEHQKILMELQLRRILSRKDHANSH